jgi:uncharacterized protein (DUF433 family)
MKPDRADGKSSLLNRGIYGGVEVARLIRRDPATIVEWTSARRSRPPFLVPQHAKDHLFSFLDLVSLYVISELIRRKVPRDEVYGGGKFLERRLQTTRPFAHEALATAGKAFFADFGEWIDVGKGGQGAFQHIIKPLLRPITYEDSFASRWHPHPNVVVDPRLQAGTPCISGTRIPTSIVVRYLRSGEDPEDIADDLRLTREQVEAATEYENNLDRAA